LRHIIKNKIASNETIKSGKKGPVNNENGKRNKPIKPNFNII
jgi:hypothetical protein